MGDIPDEKWLAAIAAVDHIVSAAVGPFPAGVDDPSIKSPKFCELLDSSTLGAYSLEAVVNPVGVFDAGHGRHKLYEADDVGGGWEPFENEDEFQDLNPTTDTLRQLLPPGCPTEGPTYNQDPPPPTPTLRSRDNPAFRGDGVETCLKYGTDDLNGDVCPWDGMQELKICGGCAKILKNVYMKLLSQCEAFDALVRHLDETECDSCIGRKDVTLTGPDMQPQGA
ncbi:hypothetical protein B0H19DRAFT_437294 [Mycena capillaripes]|nr:hypothetical protein B0H19DRAFT_437294 [Mycena capillaripes]